MELIDAETLRRRAVFEAFEDTPATAIEYSPDGQRLAVAGGRGLIGLWDSSSGRRVGALLDAPQGPCSDPSATFTMPRCYEGTIQGALAFVGDDLLAAANIRGELQIWDLDDRELLHPPLRLPPFVVELALSPDGSQVAVPFGYNNRGPDGIEIRDVVGGERVARLSTDEEVRSVAFSPNGGRLVGGQVDGTVVVWTTDDWQQVGRPLSVGRGFVLGLDFSPDGQTLAASNFDGTVALWDPEAREPIGSPLPGPANWVTARFTPDGRRLFTVYENGPAFRWEVDPAVWGAHACAVAGGGLTPAQWDEVVPEQDYRQVCPE